MRCSPGREQVSLPAKQTRGPAVLPESPHAPAVPPAPQVAFLIGDGDNIAYLKGSRRSWVGDRVQRCNGSKASFPLLWTMSPHVLRRALPT